MNTNRSPILKFIKFFDPFYFNSFPDEIDPFFKDLKGYFIMFIQYFCKQQIPNLTLPAPSEKLIDEYNKMAYQFWGSLYNISIPRELSFETLQNKIDVLKNVINPLLHNLQSNLGFNINNKLENNSLQMNQYFDTKSFL